LSTVVFPGAASFLNAASLLNSESLWTRRDPFAEFDALVRRFFGPTASRPALEARAFTPAAEVTRDGDDAVLRVEAPGLDAAKDVVVEVEGGRLVVRGERRERSTREQDGRAFSEVRYGAFRRSFDLPAHVTADAVTASYESGVLTVRVAGAYISSEPRRIAVTSGTAQTAALEPGDEASSEAAGE
jgi:HSP20 family protein